MVERIGVKVNAHAFSKPEPGKLSPGPLTPACFLGEALGQPGFLREKLGRRESALQQIGPWQVKELEKWSGIFF